MFIKRLTEEQVKDFLDKQYDKDYLKYEFTPGERITGIVEYLTDNEEFDSFWLSDFEVIWSHSSSMKNDWLRYLYKVFGEEYKEAYLAECAKVFE